MIPTPLAVTFHKPNVRSIVTGLVTSAGCN